MELREAPPMVQRFAPNHEGRDFVVGDLHGCFALLDAALERLGFDPEVDRLFSVGDLIDRGPASFRAPEYLAQPWFHAVRGNHEMLMLDAVRSGDAEDIVQWVGNGGNWWYPDHEKLLPSLSEVVDCLPYAMEVETPRGTVGIVHADVPENEDWPSFMARLQHPDDHHYRDLAVWSRKRFSGRVNKPVPGIHRVIVGHSITAKPFLRDNVIFLDTGAYLEYRKNTRGGLTVLNLHTWEFRTFRLSREDLPADMPPPDDDQIMGNC